jgi:eukaryotic-like serine/threonine-protein kinase
MDLVTSNLEPPTAPERTGEAADAHAQPTASPVAPKACPSCGTRYPVDALFCSLDGAPLTTSHNVIAAAAEADPYLTREILGHIEIRQLVGIGAMGRVYRAFQKGIDRDVAVKVLHRELSSNQTLVARFHREAKVASRLAHPNVVHVLLAGQLPDGAMYIVMEYLDGMSLQSALGAAGGALPLPRALHIALQLCDAAGEGHQQGVVHRDLKPENVMLVLRADDPDFVKVLDFGIARLNWGEQSMATAAGLIFGTARYISPEGARGDQVGPEGDVYSIATMLYQMLSGRAPFEADQAVALLVQQIHDPPHDLRGLPRASYVPEPIAAVVMRNLSKKPADRAPNGRAFARDLLEAAVTSGMSAQEILTRGSMLGGARGSHPSAVQMPSMQRTQQLAIEVDGAGRALPATTSLEAPARAAMEGIPVSDGRTEVRTEIVDRRSASPTSLVSGATTTKWSPSSDFERRIARPPSKPPSSVDATLAGDALTPMPSTRLAAAPPALHGPLLVGLCLLVALSGMALVGWRVGLLGRGAVHTETAPPPREVVAETLHDPVVPALVEGPVAPLPPLDVTAPRASAPHASAVASPSGSAAPAAAPAVRVAIEASSTRPSVGQPVDFAVHVVGSGPAAGSPRRLDGARFRIVGPGITQGTELPAFDDGDGDYRTTFTFLQAGRFDVDFAAKADGAPVHTVRSIAVGDVTAAAPPPPPAPAPTRTPPPGSAATKWL